ncbi:MAG TPA: hypothetical protein VI669_18955 [Vicinamibacteria bacterium]
MPGTGRVVGAVLLMAVTVAAQAADPKPDFEARKTEAMRNFKSDAGKEYAESFGKEFGAEYAPTLNSCSQETGAAMGENFDLLLKIGAMGAVEEALVKPETKLAECFRKKVQARTYPAPPSAGYWVVYGMKFTKAPAP